MTAADAREPISDERLAQIREKYAKHHWTHTLLDPTDPLGSPCDPDWCDACMAHDLLDELERLRAERSVSPKMLRLAWRNGWADHAEAVQTVQQQAVRNRNVFESRFGILAQQWLADPAPQLPTCGYHACSDPSHRRGEQPERGGEADGAFVSARDDECPKCEAGETH